MHSKLFPIKISEFSREIRIVQFRKFLNIKMIIRVYLGQNGLIIFLMIPSSKSQYSNIFQLACQMFTPDTLMDATTIMSKLLLQQRNCLFGDIENKQTCIHLFCSGFVSSMLFELKMSLKVFLFARLFTKRDENKVFVEQVPYLYCFIICIKYSIGPI